MKLDQKLIDELEVRPGSAANLASRSTSATRGDWLGSGEGSHTKGVAEDDLERFKVELSAAQELLYAADRWSLLLIFQALDAGGKDGTIKHVMSGVNPQGCQVFSFKEPSNLELRHDFLWRCSSALPERGRIGIFNRSYYEEVLVVRVHPELLEAERLPSVGVAGTHLWQQRYEDINAFEHHLSRNGTRTVKFFLHVSKEEQRRRLLARLDDPSKLWKFGPSDLSEHQRYDDYQAAYEDALSATSTAWAPWYVIPADHKYTMRALVGGIVVNSIDHLHLQMPTPDATQRPAIDSARRELEGELAEDSGAKR